MTQSEIYRLVNTWDCTLSGWALPIGRKAQIMHWRASTISGKHYQSCGKLFRNQEIATLGRLQLKHQSELSSVIPLEIFLKNILTSGPDVCLHMHVKPTHNDFGNLLGSWISPSTID